MYKKITPNERVTRTVNNEHSIDNYLTKETTENISLAVSKLNGELKLSKTLSERVYYFIKANAEFNIEGEIVFVNDGDVLYIPSDTSYSIKGIFEAVTVNTPAFGVNRDSTNI